MLPAKKRNGLSEISAGIDPSLISLRRNCEMKRMKVSQNTDKSCCLPLGHVRIACDNGIL